MGLQKSNTTERLSTQHKYSPPSFSHHQYLALSKTIFKKKKCAGRKILFYLSTPQYFSFWSISEQVPDKSFQPSSSIHTGMNLSSLFTQGCRPSGECHQDCRLPWAMGSQWFHPTGLEKAWCPEPPTRVLFPLRPLFVVMVSRSYLISARVPAACFSRLSRRNSC